MTTQIQSHLHLYPQGNMEDKKKKIDINASKSTELPGSKEEEAKKVVMPREASPYDQPDAVSSARTEELLVSPGSGSSVGRPKTLQQTLRLERLAAELDSQKRKKAKAEKRQRAKEAKEEKGRKREDASRKATNPHATASSSAETSKAALAGWLVRSWSHKLK